MFNCNNIICSNLLPILIIGVLGVSGANFWLTTELLHLEWKKECSATKYCTRPQLRLTQQNLVNSESLSVNWVFTEDVVTDYARPFVTYWIRGTPNDISITTEIIGFDPKYGFQRICDFTAAKRIFLPIDNQANIIDLIDVKSFKANNRRMIVELSGKCFEASLAVQKHLDVCPWCTTVPPSPTPVPIAVAAAAAVPMIATTPTPTDFLKAHATEASLFSYFSDTQTMLILLASVATAFFACTGFICLLLAFYRIRNEPQQKQQQNKVFTLLPINMPNKPLNPSLIINPNRKYEDKQQRPILRWDSNSTTQTLTTSENASVNSAKTTKAKGYMSVKQISDDTVYENMGSTESVHCQKYHIVPASV